MDTQTIFYTVVALVPNLLIILIVMARMNQQIRILSSEMAATRRDMQLLEQGVKDLTEILRSGKPPTSEE